MATFKNLSYLSLKSDVHFHNVVHISTPLRRWSVRLSTMSTSASWSLAACASGRWAVCMATVTSIRTAVWTPSASAPIRASGHHGTTEQTVTDPHTERCRRNNNSVPASLAGAERSRMGRATVLATCRARAIACILSPSLPRVCWAMARPM